jgi:hypothetical protein
MTFYFVSSVLLNDLERLFFLLDCNNFLTWRWVSFGEKLVKIYLPEPTPRTPSSGKDIPINVLNL